MPTTADLASPRIPRQQNAKQRAISQLNLAMGDVERIRKNTLRLFDLNLLHKSEMNYVHCMCDNALRNIKYKRSLIK